MTKPTVSLVLGSGGARGYAHIGAIEELLAQGFDIRCIAGSSMGALIGGVYAAGKLEEYREWVVSLQRLDVLRMLDWTFRGGGLIKGDRIIDKLRELTGDVLIENLPLSYTAVAVDLPAQREVWFSRGSLFDAIRASIAVPAVFRPHRYLGRTLVDGGLLNPVPVTATLRDLTDCTIAVDVNAPAEKRHQSSRPDELQDIPAVETGEQVNPDSPMVLTGAEMLADETQPEQRGYRQVLAGFYRRLRRKPDDTLTPTGDPNLLQAFALSLDAVQETLTRFKLAAQPPDLLISIPRTACAFYEFHRAAELIELGRERTREALKDFDATSRD